MQSFISCSVTITQRKRNSPEGTRKGSVTPSIPHTWRTLEVRKVSSMSPSHKDEDILYSYKREEETSTVVLTSAGTRDSHTEHGSSITMFHKDRFWVIETESKKTKYVIDDLEVPSFDLVHFARNYWLPEETGELGEFFQETIREIIQEIEGWGLHLQLRSGILRYKYRDFYVENCHGDSVSVEYPIVGVELYLGENMLYHISHGGCLGLSQVKERLMSLIREECTQIEQMERVETKSLRDFKVTSVALSGYVLGTLLHEAVGHLLEYDHARTLKVHKGDALTSNPEPIVHESPENTSSFGFCPCSDEGAELGKTILLRNGIVHDFLTSLSFSTIPYNHGRAQRCSDLPLPRNTSLSMERGKERGDILSQGECTLYIHKGIKSTLVKVEKGIPFYHVEVPTAYIVKNGTFLGRISNICMNLGFEHFFDNAYITSKMRGNQVGYCVKSQQQVESTQFAPDIAVPAENVHIHVLK